LANIKNVGAGIVEGIIAARDEGGPFASIEDFCQRVSFRQLNKRALECMIKAGALDGLGNRGTLLANLDRLMNLAQSAQKLKESGQATLFDIFQETAPSLTLALQEAEVPRSEQLAWEKELLGVYVSEHPFTRAAAALGPRVTAMCSEVSEEMNGREMIIAGSVTHIRQILTRAGRPFLAVEMEDLTGAVEVTVWPDVYDQTRDLWVEGAILLLTVRVRTRNDRLQVSVQNVVAYEEGSEPDPEPVGGFNGPIEAPRPVRVSHNPAPRPKSNGPREMRITLHETEDTDSDHERLRAVMSAIQEFEGDDHVRLTIRQQDGDEVDLELPRARACDELGQRLSGALGDAGTVAL
jgi:DNA polymerase-3 subunit alpha